VKRGIAVAPNRSAHVLLLARILVGLLVGLLMVCAGCVAGCATQTTLSDDQAFTTAYEEHQSGIQVFGSGTVVRILADDDQGSRHQRFIVALASGQTLLISHSIDVAPRVPGLEEGDRVEFSGVYEWNSEGGLVHWTHHDPGGLHRPGWIKHQGSVYD